MDLYYKKYQEKLSTDTALGYKKKHTEQGLKVTA